MHYEKSCDSGVGVQYCNINIIFILLIPKERLQELIQAAILNQKLICFHNFKADFQYHGTATFF